MEGEREDLRKKLYTYSVKSNKTFDMSYDYMAVFVSCGGEEGERDREREKQGDRGEGERGREMRKRETEIDIRGRGVSERGCGK